MHGITSLGLTQLRDLEIDLGPVNRRALELFVNALRTRPILLPQNERQRINHDL